MHPEILSEQQRLLLPFVQSLKKEFYLVGGTAIALHPGHRQSIDFDLFKKTVTLFPGLFSDKLFRQQLCYFDDVDYMEEVSYLPGYAVNEEEVKSFLIDISTREL
jgi:phosphopantetheine adenylyltransferase